MSSNEILSPLVLMGVFWVCFPSQVRIEQVIVAEPGAVLLYKVSNLLKFYHHTIRYVLYWGSHCLYLVQFDSSLLYGYCHVITHHHTALDHLGKLPEGRIILNKHLQPRKRITAVV